MKLALAPFALSLLPFTLAQDCPQKLIAADGDTSDEAGYDVAIDGDVAFVGARFESQLGSSAGAVYLWRRGPSGWFESQKLLGSAQLAFDELGRSVDALGELMLAGARGDDSFGSNSGAAYVFRGAGGGAYVEEIRLLAPDAEAGDRFGAEVVLGLLEVAPGIVQEWAFVGAPDEDDRGNAAGAGYAFVNDPVLGWSFTQKLLANDGQAFDRFCSALAVDGPVLVCGAFGDDDRGADAGAAYIRRYDPLSGTWIEEAKLRASDGLPGDQFGWQVAVAGDVAVIGAPRADTLGLDSGSAYIFRYDTVLGVWSEEQKLVAPDGAAGDAFGVDVAIEGERIVVGADAHDGAAVDTGAVYVFERDAVTGAWLLVAKAAAADPDAGDLFGVTIDLSGGRLISGAMRDDQRANNAGAAYVYDLNAVDRNGDAIPDACQSAGLAFCTASANSTGRPASIAALGSSSLAANGVTLWVSDLPQNVLGYFIVSQGTLEIPNAGGAQGTLCIASASLGRYAGNVLSSGALGRVSLPIDALALPTPLGNVAASAGETWNFQLWHRDAVGGSATSNFSDAVAVQFQQ